MASNKRPLYLCCEGHTCSGKSTTLKLLEQKQHGVMTLETVVKRWPAEFQPSIDFFLKQDEDKYQRAKQSQADIVLIDRGYLSTLVYYTVFENGRCKESVLRWIQEGYETGRLWRPDYYLHFDLEISKISERALRGGRVIDANNVWYHQPQAVNSAYIHYFASLECDVPIFRIDTNQSPEAIAQEVWTFLTKLHGGRNGD